MDKKTRVSDEELLALTKKAFDNDEVTEFLCGEKGYACPLDRFVPANVPTDFGRIVNLGVCRLYTETQNEEIVERFKKAVLSLLNGNAVQIWVAYSVCWNLMYKRIHNKPTIVISDNNFWETVRSSVQKNEDKLRLCKEWQGFNLENGLWEDIKRMDKNLTADGEGIL